jgi:hypothetical protein
MGHSLNWLYHGASFAARQIGDANAPIPAAQGCVARRRSAKMQLAQTRKSYKDFFI